MIAPHRSSSSEEIANHYDSLGDFYRDVWGDRLHHGYWIEGDESPDAAVSQLQEAILALAKLSPGDQVCDIGSGYGETAFHLAREEKASVVAWTLSADQYKVSNEKAESLTGSGTGSETGSEIRPVFHHGDWLENTIPDQSLDAVIAIESFSHFPDPEAFFAEVARVLRPGGRLALADWTAGQAPSPMQRRLLLEPICFEGHLSGLVTGEELSSLLAGAGLEATELHWIGTQVRQTWRVITARVLRKMLSDGSYRRFFFHSLRGQRKFPLTIARLLLAYRTGALDYCLLGARKRR